MPTTPILGFDIKGFSQKESNPVKTKLRSILETALNSCLKGKNIPFKPADLMEGGDGFMLPVETVNIEEVVQFFIEFNAHLAQCNEMEKKEHQIKVRGVIHFGSWEKETVFGEGINGKTTPIGTDIDTTARYLDSQPLRDLRNKSGKDFIFGLSDKVVETIKNSGFWSREEANFAPQPVKVKQFEGSIWLYTEGQSKEQEVKKKLTA